MSYNKFGILIANQDYPDGSGFQPLVCPHNDVEALQEVLSHPDHGEFTQVVVLKEKPRRDILLGIENVLEKAERNDLVLLYFSGHGKIDAAGKFFFAAQDTQADRLLATGINGSDISQLIRDANVSKKALVLDCCHAGAIMRNWRGDPNIIQTRADEFARGSGTYVLMATGELDVAEENPEDGMGVMTRYLVDGLRGEADMDRDGIVTLRELSRFVERQVVDFHNQKPFEAGLNKHGDIAISKSGIEPDRELRARIKSRLFAWASEDEIPHGILTEALAILDKEMDLDDQDKLFRAILNRVAEDDLKPAHMVYEWNNTLAAAPATATKPEPEPEPETTPEPEKSKTPVDPAAWPKQQPGEEAIAQTNVRSADAAATIGSKPKPSDPEIWGVPGSDRETGKMQSAARSGNAGFNGGIMAAIGWVALAAVTDLGSGYWMGVILSLPETYAAVSGVVSMLVAWALMGFRKQKARFGFVARQILAFAAGASIVWGMLMFAVSIGISF